MRSLVVICGVYFAVAPAVFSQTATVPVAGQSATDPGAENSALIMDRPGERQTVMRKAHDDLYAGNFDSLEGTERDFRTSGSRFPDGFEKVSAFYEGLSNPWARGESAWTGFLDKITAWQKAKPDSIVAAAVMGQALANYSWVARGNGYADTVTTEGWQLLIFSR
jgi:hypothetical protein